MKGYTSKWVSPMMLTATQTATTIVCATRYNAGAPFVFLVGVSATPNLDELPELI